jgi:hypothetical protein
MFGMLPKNTKPNIFWFCVWLPLLGAVFVPKPKPNRCLVLVLVRTHMQGLKRLLGLVLVHYVVLHLMAVPKPKSNMREYCTTSTGQQKLTSREAPLFDAAENSANRVFLENSYTVN